SQVRLDEFGPLSGDGARELCVAIARKVDQQELWRRLHGLCEDPDEIDSASASWCGADMGESLSQQRIDQAGFANVGAPEECDFGRTFRRKSRRAAGRGQEFGDDWFHVGAFVRLRMEREKVKERRLLLAHFFSTKR